MNIQTEAAALPPTIMRGAKVRLYPNKTQGQTMDLWRRRTISLWNLLLSFEQAAYSGENIRPEIRWRQIWAGLVQANYEKDMQTYQHGWIRKDGSARKEPGVGREEERQALRDQLKTLSKGTREHEETKNALALIAPKPVPIDELTLEKIKRQAFETTINAETGEVTQERAARLFIWERELMALMAALKQEPLTAWIGDLPSHAAQAIVKDLIKALESMLRERKKRANGGGRDTGFPKFKKSRYAAGAVYLANTQMFFDADRKHVKLPNGVGAIRCDSLDRELRIFDSTGKDTGLERTRITGSNIPKDAKLMGGRIWREGEDWYLSCQWTMKRPAPLPPTVRQAGVKIAAAILLTTYDERGTSREYQTPAPDKRLGQRHRRAAQKMARSLEGHKKRVAKLKARGKNINGGKVRLRRTKDFFEAAERLANLEATERNRRDDHLHKLTTKVVREFGTLQVQKMEVAKLMKKPRLPKPEDAAAQADDKPKRRNLKPVRKLMRHVAMSRCRQLLEYKARDLGRSFGETDTLFPDVQTCSRCGTQNPQMKDGRRVLRCINDACLAVLPRNRNAAANELKLAKKRLEAGNV